jgi:hypothetical protein
MAAGTEPIRERTVFRDLGLEELQAAQAELRRRIAVLADAGVSERLAELRVIAGSEPIVEGEPVADTALRFGVLPASDLEDRVAALEECVRYPLRSFVPEWTPLTEAEEAEVKASIGEAAKFPQRIRVPLETRPLSLGDIHCILRECVTVVKPGETLIVRGTNWTPAQTREIQQAMDEMYELGIIPFKALAVFGDELGVAEFEP